MTAAVIMAGGRGERFWPASRRGRPKQFLHLAGEQTLLQQAVARVLPLCGPERTFVVTLAEHAAETRRQLPELAAGQILAEPEGRNTAPCTGLAAAYLSRALGPETVQLVLPADHHISDEERFRRCLAAAAEAAAETGDLVTMGLRPTRPETGYGYIQLGQAVGRWQGMTFHRAERFVEKPAAARAQAMLASGRFLWNSGMFAWRTDAFLRELQRWLPQMAPGLDRIAAAAGSSDFADAVARAYREFPVISVDHGVLERTDRILVLPADFGWDDVGSWPALARVLPPAGDDNVTAGDVVALDAEGCVLQSSPGRLVAALGVRDLVVVATADAVLVCPTERAQDVRRLVEEVRRRGWEHYL